MPATLMAVSKKNELPVRVKVPSPAIVTVFVVRAGAQG
jgi:hypothetical protein